MQKLLVMGSYLLELLPGDVNKVDKQALSYYQYLNDSRLRLQTGKNVQSVMWCLEGTPKGVRIEEPFGGVGVFSIALNRKFSPSYHKIIEIDDQCYHQLKHSLRDCDNINIIHGDSHEHMGKDPVDVSVADLPYFGIRRYKAGEWIPEIERTLNHGPSRMLITDGCRYNYHMHWESYKEKYDSEVNDNPESYVYMMSKLFYKDYGYSVTRSAYHGSCFYYLLEPLSPGTIEFNYFGAGTGERGLKVLDEPILESFLVENNNIGVK